MTHPSVQTFVSATNKLTRAFRSLEDETARLGWHLGAIEPHITSDEYRLQMIALGVDRRRAKREARKLLQHSLAQKPLE